eukprot:COSAG01_NODE_29610_length_633_cov_11.535581_1_plen_46_part_10
MKRLVPKLEVGHNAFHCHHHWLCHSSWAFWHVAAQILVRVVWVLLN